MEEMRNLLIQERFTNISPENKAFLLAFDEKMTQLGYGIIEVADAYKWARNWLSAKYMINYAVTGIKAKRLAAHIFVKEDGLFLRLFALKKSEYSHNTKQQSRSVIEPHRAYIESAPSYIKSLFTNRESDCDHTHENADGFCWRLDCYTVDGERYEKCIGKGFDFPDPTMSQLPDYIGLLVELNAKNIRGKREE